MEATQKLPEHYQSIGTFDLRNNPQELMRLNLVGLVLFGLTAWIFSMLLFLLRPEDAAQGLSFGFTNLGGLIQAVLAILATTVLMIVLHEAVHGFFFWLFTRSIPRFAFKGVYAYAAAPNWYLPKNRYLVVALAPLILLSLLGVGLMLVLPPQTFILLLLFLVSNASGAVGDLWVVAWLLRQPAACLANDHGDAVTLYVKEETK